MASVKGGVMSFLISGFGTGMAAFRACRHSYRNIYLRFLADMENHCTHCERYPWTTGSQLQRWKIPRGDDFRG